MFGFWQMVWEQEVHLIVTLSSIDSQECLPFWPSTGQIGETLSWENPTKQHQLRVVMIEELDAPSRRSIRVSLEVIIKNRCSIHGSLVNALSIVPCKGNTLSDLQVTSTGLQSLHQQQQAMNGNGNVPPAAITETRDIWIFLTPNWPQQCSPLSTVFDLIKVTDEEHHGLRGPIVTVDR